MRRLFIIYHWIFRSRNNVKIFELASFLFKPKVKKIASRFISKITVDRNWFSVRFKEFGKELFWPKEFPLNGIYQVTSETFDKNDWHYYQKKNTEIITGEKLLDIGAAEGLFALSVVDKCDSIILIEPNSYFIHSLKKTFASYLNKVKIHEYAVGNYNGIIEFNETSLHGSVSNNGTHLNKKEIVKIDSIIGSQTKITYLKADIEGFEQEMLKGAETTIKTNKPKIAITSYHNENDATEIIDIVKSFVPEYNHYVKGVSHISGKPVMIHFWI
mgnify:CR=1 FL=1